MRYRYLLYILTVFCPTKVTFNIDVDFSPFSNMFSKLEVFYLGSS
jgi:hypothetical protein